MFSDSLIDDFNAFCSDTFLSNNYSQSTCSQSKPPSQDFSQKDEESYLREELAQKEQAIEKLSNLPEIPTQRHVLEHEEMMDIREQAVKWRIGQLTDYERQLLLQVPKHITYCNPWLCPALYKVKSSNAQTWDDKVAWKID